MEVVSSMDSCRGRKGRGMEEGEGRTAWMVRQDTHTMCVKEKGEWRGDEDGELIQKKRKKSCVTQNIYS